MFRKGILKKTKTASVTLLIYSVTIVCCLFASCENKEVNHADGPNFNEIHEDMHLHFDEITIDETQYYILERDRNNPHEGFGFMALKGKNINRNQDTIKAYLKTILHLQSRILASQTNTPLGTVEKNASELFQFYFQEKSIGK